MGQRGKVPRGSTNEAGNSGEAVANDVTREVRLILRSAEGLAAALRREAECQAEALIEEARQEAARRLDDARREADAIRTERVTRLNDLSDQIVARAEVTLGKLEAGQAARTHLDRLLDEIARATEGLEGEAVAHGQGRPGDHAVRAVGPVRRLESVDVFAPRQPTGVDPLGDRVDSFDVPRQVAFEMAVAGSTRAEVAAHLQRTFGLADAHVVLNEAFPNADGRT